MSTSGNSTSEPQWVIHAPKPIHPNTFELREGAISPRHFKLPYTAEVKLTPSPPLARHHSLPPNLNKPWAIPFGKSPYYHKTHTTKGEAISPKHVKLPHTAIEKPHPALLPPQKHSLPSNLKRFDQSPNDAAAADNTNIHRNHHLPSMAEKQAAPVSTLELSGEARGLNSQYTGTRRMTMMMSSSAAKNAVSRWATIQEQDEQVAESAPST